MIIQGRTELTSFHWHTLDHLLNRKTTALHFTCLQCLFTICNYETLANSRCWRSPVWSAHHPATTDRSPICRPCPSCSRDCMVLARLLPQLFTLVKKTSASTSPPTGPGTRQRLHCWKSSTASIHNSWRQADLRPYRAWSVRCVWHHRPLDTHRAPAVGCACTGCAFDYMTVGPMPLKSK